MSRTLRMVLAAALTVAGVLISPPAYGTGASAPAAASTSARSAMPVIRKPAVPTVGPHDCARVRRQLAELARAGRQAVTCVQQGQAPKGMTVAQAAGTPAARVTPDGLGPNPTPPPIPTECGSAFPNGTIVYDRYHQCTVHQQTLSVIQVPGGAVLGVGQVQVIHVITLNARVRQWTDDIHLNMYQATGVMVTGARIFPYFDWTPLASVRQISESPPPNWIPLTLNQSLYGRWTLGADQTSATVVATDQFHYIFEHALAQTSSTMDTVRSQQMRCDSLRIFGSPAYNNGCVFQIVAPIFTLNRSDPAVAEAAQHIYNAQRSLPDHWGWIDNGPPLHRLYDPVKRRRNHDVACAGFVPDAAGDQCDEYPFASTYEGASFVGRNRVSVASIIGSHNTTAGSRLGGFYRDQRVIDGEAFWVHVA
jgi:Deoxyribonuclease NucA/NucB